MLIVIKVILGLLATWFGLWAFIRGIMYFGFDFSEDLHEVCFPHIKFVFPFKEFIINLLIAILLIVIIIIL